MATGATGRNRRRAHIISGLMLVVWMFTISIFDESVLLGLVSAVKYQLGWFWGLLSFSLGYGLFCLAIAIALQPPTWLREQLGIDKLKGSAINHRIQQLGSTRVSLVLRSRLKKIGRWLWTDGIARYLKLVDQKQARQCNSVIGLAIAISIGGGCYAVPMHKIYGWKGRQFYRISTVGGIAFGVVWFILYGIFGESIMAVFSAIFL